MERRCPVKTCSKCGGEYPATTEFFREEKRASVPALRAQCRECDRTWTRDNRERQNEYKARWKERHPSKTQAHHMVEAALDHGRLAREPCEACGSPDTQSHHDDYSKPLDVRWLCIPHHAEWHQDMQRELSRLRLENEELARLVAKYKWQLDEWRRDDLF